MSEEIPTKYCERIKSNIFAESAEDLTGKIYVQCKYYDSRMCIKADAKNKRCLVKLAVQREEKRKLSSKISS